MSAYLITKKDSEVLDTAVYAAGNEEEIVMMFTDSQKAQQYIDDADLAGEHTVATLDEIAFVEWLIHCHRSGVDLLATNPARSDQENGRKVGSISIKAQLQEFGEKIVAAADGGT